MVEILPPSLSVSYFIALLNWANPQISSCLSSRSVDNQPRLGAGGEPEAKRKETRSSTDGFFFFGGCWGWEDASPWQSPCTAGRVLHSEQSASFDLAWRDTQGQSLHLEPNCTLIRSPRPDVDIRLARMSSSPGGKCSSYSAAKQCGDNQMHCSVFFLLFYYNHGCNYWVYRLK